MQDTHVLDSFKVNTYPQSYAHTIFIDEHIAETTYYRNVISTLNSAQEGDTIQMIIDTNGGLGSTAMTLTHAMDGCKAKITGVLSGNCKSAGTVIALHCHDWEIGHGLDWLAHTASFGIGGEANKVAKWHDHEQKLIRELLFREYEGFYTTEEIEDIAQGNDSLLTPKEVGQRLEKFAEHRANRINNYHQEMEDALWEENNAMVEEALNTLDITVEERDTFNKVKHMLDSSLSEEDIESSAETHTADVEAATLKEELINVPFISESGAKVGDLYFIEDKGIPVDIELSWYLDEEEYVICVHEDFLCADARGDLLSIMNKLTGRSYSSWNTKQLIKTFIREVYRQIKENT